MLEKQEFTVSTRLDYNTLEGLKEYAAQYKKSKSKVLRRAVLNHLRTARKDEDAICPMITIPKNEFKFMLDLLSPEQVEKYAEISYQNDLNTRQEEIKILARNVKTEIKFYLRGIIYGYANHIFAHDGQNWLKKHEIKFYGRSYQLAGIHDLGMNYSIYLKALFKKISLDYSYVLVKEILKEDRFYLEFQKDEKIKNIKK